MYETGWHEGKKAKSCSILDDRGRNPRDETFIQGIVVKETNEPSSNAIGCDSG
jgi:hypothetical protein